MQTPSQSASFKVNLEDSDAIAHIHELAIVSPLVDGRLMDVAEGRR